MRCERCGRDFAAGLGKCPHCGAAAHYGGNTAFYGKVIESKLTIADLFSDVLKKHSKGAGAKMFMAGTPTTTPAPAEMLSEWQKPWLFARVFAVGMIFAVLCYFMASMGMSATVYSLFSLCALIVPISLVIFYWEANIPRDIPLYTVLLMLVVGGVLSLLFTFFGSMLTKGIDLSAAFIEEPAKLIAVAVFVYYLDPKYIFGGLLIGAAVGAGFASIENIYYVFEKGGLGTLLLRSVTALGGHVAYAGIEGGALLMAKGSEKLAPKHFLNPRFLAGFATSITLHYINNSSAIRLGQIPFFGDLKILLKLIAAVLAMFFLLKRAVAQVLAVADNAQLIRPSASREAGCHATLHASSGPLTGSYFPLHQSSVTIGCDPSQCNIVLPAGTPGVSRRHCTLELRPDGVVYLMDHNSSYGTFWESGQRIPSNQWVPMPAAAFFFLGSQEVSFRCVVCIS